MAAVAVGLDAVVGEALACPVCDTATGVAVREAIFNGEFPSNAFSVLLPFPSFSASWRPCMSDGVRGGW
jgi:hypothetical protein